MCTACVRALWLQISMASLGEGCFLMYDCMTRYWSSRWDMGLARVYRLYAHYNDSYRNERDFASTAMIDCLFPSLAGQSLTAFVMTVIPKVIHTMVMTWPGASAVCSIAGF